MPGDADVSLWGGRMAAHSRTRSAAYRRSATVALVLALLTVIEFFAALYFNSIVILMLMALFKAVLVLNYFMHVSRLWTPDEEGHEA